MALGPLRRSLAQGGNPIQPMRSCVSQHGSTGTLFGELDRWIAGTPCFEQEFTLFTPFAIDSPADFFECCSSLTHVMKTLFVFLVMALWLCPAAHGQFLRQPGVSDVTIIETWRGVQRVSTQTISVTRNGKITVCTRTARASDPPLGGTGCVQGKMRADGSFSTSGNLDDEDETPVTIEGKFQKNGKFTLVRQIGDEEPVELKGRAIVGGFSLTGTYHYTLGGKKVTGRISGTFHPAP